MIRVLDGDCRALLASLPAESVQMVCTSPPYYGLRSYGIGIECGEIGCETSPDAYVAAMVEVFRGVKRVLRNDGLVFLNLGDLYINKQLQMMPARVAFALQADGWWLRSAIVWQKPSPMPESVTDRPTSSYEMVFMLAKAERYYYDNESIAEPTEYPELIGKPQRVDYRPKDAMPDGMVPAQPKQVIRGATRNARNVWTIATQPYSGAHFATMPPELAERCILAGTSEKGCCGKCGAPWARVVEREATTYDGRARPSPSQSGGTHRRDCDGMQRGIAYRTQTTGWAPSCTCNADVVPCVVLDCFMGAGTTILVSERLGRNSIGIELNPSYCDLARKRVTADCPLFAEVAD